MTRLQLLFSFEALVVEQSKSMLSLFVLKPEVALASTRNICCIIRAPLFICLNTVAPSVQKS